jgi:hypothetical protein
MKTIRITTIITLDNTMFADWCQNNRNLSLDEIGVFIKTKKLTLSRTPTSVTHYELVDHDQIDNPVPNDRP